MTIPAFEALHRDATAVLAGWNPPDGQQAQMREEYLAFLSEHPDGMAKACRIGHLTASALVMDVDRTRVLLTLHPKVGRWLQLGGHCEPEDDSLVAAARREAVEESGIAEVAIVGEPLRLDRHPVPCAGGRSEHLDVQYLGLVASNAREVISDESDDLRWFGLDALPDGLDASVLALVQAAVAR